MGQTTWSKFSDRDLTDVAEAARDAAIERTACMTLARVREVGSWDAEHKYGTLSVEPFPLAPEETEPSLVTAYRFAEAGWETDQIILVGYTDRDFRPGLNQAKAGHASGQLHGRYAVAIKIN